jgi:hypothetical protein
MPIELKKINLSLSEMDRAILLESYGCSFDDIKAKAFKYSYSECVLVLQALAKKMLGIDGVAIGNNPQRAEKLGLSSGTRDFAEERRRAKKDMKDKATLDSFMQRLKKEEDFVKQLADAFDGPAWNAVNELTEILSRRAMALHRAGFVVYNVSNMAADEAEQRDKLQGGTGEAPMEGSVALTEKGARCVSTQRFPVIKRRQRADAHQFDYDVELPKR